MLANQKTKLSSRLVLKKVREEPSRVETDRTNTIKDKINIETVYDQIKSFVKSNGT